MCSKANAQAAKKILIIIATHGDELIGFEVVENLRKLGLGDLYKILIANPKALKLKKRFVDFDLNRAYPGSVNSKMYEKRKAVENFNIAKDFDYCLDLHEASSGQDDFIIIPRESIGNKFPIDKINLKKILLWPDTKGPLAQIMDNAIELEFGMKNRDRKQIIKKATSVVADFIININNRQLIKNNKQEFYKVYGKLMNSDYSGTASLRDFKEVEVNNEKFLPLLTDQYIDDGIKCYKMKEISAV